MTPPRSPRRATEPVRAATVRKRSADTSSSAHRGPDDGSAGIIVTDMDRRSGKFLCVSGPAAVFALAAAMPLAAVAQAPVACTGERAESIAKCVSQAARQFCGNPVVVHVEPATFLCDEPEVRYEVIRFEATFVLQFHICLSMIDLPPPVL